MVVFLIIGIVISVVLVGGVLVDKARLSDAKAKTYGSIINDLKAVELWLETSLDESFQGDAEKDQRESAKAITRWNSIHKHNISKEVEVPENPNGQEFWYFDIGINKIPTIRFDAYGGTEAGGATSLTINNLYFLEEDAGFSFIIVQQGGNVDSGANSSVDLFSCNNNNNELLTALRAELPLDQRPHIMSYIYSPSEDNKIYKNGAEISGSSYNIYYSDQSNNIIEECFIGGINYNADVSEIIIFSESLSDATLQKVHEYLAKKYDIKI